MGKIDDLEKLQKLKESGALTKEEFENEKNKILEGNYNENTKVVHKLTKKHLLFLILSIIIIILLVICFIIFSKNTPKSLNQPDNTLQYNQISEIEQENNEIITNTLENDTDLTQQIMEYPIATLNVKDYGTIKLELYYDKAPNTVKNFIALANNGFYDNLTFHRIVNDFMVQGGDRNGNGTGNATLSSLDTSISKGSNQDKEYSIKGEFSKNGYLNDIKFEKGILAMARADYSSILPSLADEGYNSASSQFFITTADASFLNGDYAAFGKVVEGMDVLEKLNNVEITAGTETPVNPPVITSIRVDTKGVTYDLPQTHDAFDINSYIESLYR